MRSKGMCSRPTYLVVHALVNKLSGIIGHCDLLLEKAEPGTEYEKRLAAICDIAHATVNELTAHRSQLSTAYEEMLPVSKGRQKRQPLPP
jgi:hypothetical protein